MRFRGGVFKEFRYGGADREKARYRYKVSELCCKVGMKFPRRISLRKAIILILPLDNLGFVYLPLATYNGLVLSF